MLYLDGVLYNFLLRWVCTSLNTAQVYPRFSYISEPADPVAHYVRGLFMPCLVLGGRASGSMHTVAPLHAPWPGSTRGWSPIYTCSSRVAACHRI